MFGLEKLFNRPPTRDEFAKLVLDHLKHKLPNLEFSFNEHQFALREANGVIVYLVNYFDNYVKADKPGRAEVLARLVGGAQEPPLPATLEEARQNLLPVLRNLPGLECALIDSGKTSLSAETATMGMRRFVADLGVGVAYDTARLVIQVGGPQCAKWGISPE